MFPADTKQPATGHRVVIIGGGVAGLDVATVLGRRRGFTVSVIDEAPTHVWKPMLHSIAAGSQDAAMVGAPYVANARRHGFAYVPGRACAIDADARQVTVAAVERHGVAMLPERTIAYDTLVLAVGSVAASFGVPGVAEHSRHIDTLAEAIDAQSEIAARLAAALHAGRTLSIAIVGGGATGVQLAAELLTVADSYDDLGIGAARDALRIQLLDRGDRLLAAFPPRVSAAAKARLESLGAAVRLDAVVCAATAKGLVLEGGAEIAADIVIWAAGVEGAMPSSITSPVKLDRAGRCIVDAHCRTSHDGIFAIGDCAAMPLGEEGRPLPPTAQVAYQQALYLGRRLPALVAGRTVPPFRYRDRGALVSLGEYDAFGSLGSYGLFGDRFLRGRIAQLGHALLYRRHQVRLHGLRRALLLWIADRARGSAMATEKLA